MDQITQTNQLASLANEYCTFTENIPGFNKEDVVFKMIALLPSIYAYMVTLNVNDPDNEDFTEVIVDEQLWEQIHFNLQSKLGQHDTYMEVFDPSIYEQEGPVTRSIAEDLADIYQDLKNFTVNYGIGTETVMELAMWECKSNFDAIWGQKATNALRALHHLYYNEKEDISEENNQDIEESGLEDIDTSNWLISKKMKEEDEDKNRE